MFPWSPFPYIKPVCLLSFACSFDSSYSDAKCQIKPSYIHHLTLRRKAEMPKSKTVIRTRFHCCRSYRQIQQTLSLGFLTDYTIIKGYGRMTAYHEKGREKGVKGGKHGPVYLSRRCWRPEESVWLWVDTNGTTQRRDKALRHFLLIKFNKPHLRHTGIQHTAFREKVNTSIL